EARVEVDVALELCHEFDIIKPGRADLNAIGDDDVAQFFPTVQDSVIEIGRAGADCEGTSDKFT
ncbi:MAG: hypothetical protein ACLQJ7_11605, partial [Syntrophobacteraceae bacterium]